MQRLWQYLGHIAFWLASPLLFVYLRIGSRTRIVLSCDDKILVVKGWLGDGKWALPGGGLHRNEEAIVGALRELKEETGVDLSPSDLQYFGTAYQKSSFFRFKYERFHGKIFVDTELRRQKWEIQDIQWVPYDTLDATNSEQSLLDTVSAWKRLSVSDTM